MKIYTKLGDQGRTFLPALGTVDKDHMVIEIIGKIDELNSHIGLLNASCVNKTQNKILLNIQTQLFTISAYLAGDETQKIPDQSAINILEKNIDKLTNNLPPLDKFILPGGSKTTAQAHLCRSLCRTVERRLVSLNKQIQIAPNILAWINRLSDYFFTLARFLNHAESKPDITWSTK